MSSNSSIVPLRWLGESQRNQLVEQIRQACSDTLSAWNNTENDLSLSVFSVQEDQLAVGSRFCVESAAGILAIWTFRTDALRCFLSLPVGSRASFHDSEFVYRLEAELVETLSRSLIAGSCGVISVRRVIDQQSVPHIARAGVRHVFRISRDGCEPCCQLELLPTLIDVMVPRKTVNGAANLKPRRAAIGHERVTVQALLGAAELSFNDLRDLRPGNVLVLNEALTGPVTLETESGRRIAEGTLGRRENNLALQINVLALPDDSAKRSVQ